MKTDIKHLLKVVSLPLAISLILPFTDFLYWGDAKRLPMLKHVWVYWSAWPTVICNFFLLFVIPILIEIILLIRWILHPCLRTGVWLAIGTFFALGRQFVISLAQVVFSSGRKGFSLFRRGRSCLTSQTSKPVQPVWNPGTKETARRRFS